MSEALEILKSCDAFLEGHFLLSSGRHSSAYCQPSRPWKQFSIRRRPRLTNGSAYKKCCKRERIIRYG